VKITLAETFSGEIVTSLLKMQRKGPFTNVACLEKLDFLILVCEMLKRPIVKSFLMVSNARAGQDNGRYISGHNSLAARARELFKHSKDPESLLKFKNWKVLGLGLFVGDVIMGTREILAEVTRP